MLLIVQTWKMGINIFISFAQQSKGLSMKNVFPIFCSMAHLELEKPPPFLLLPNRFTPPVNLTPWFLR